MEEKIGASQKRADRLISDLKKKPAYIFEKRKQARDLS